MDVPYRLFLILHIAAGTLAVITGLLALIARKPFVPGGVVHVPRGRWFAWSMAVVIGTAIVLTAMRFTPYLAALTASAALTSFSGLRVLRRKRPDADAAQRATWLDWSVTLLCTSVAASMAVMIVRGLVVQNLAVLRALAFGTLAMGTYDVWRFARPASFPCTPNLWLYEHIVKMLGAYFAAVAAFSGSVLLLFPPPWRQLWATFAGQLLTVVLVIRWYRIMNARRDSRTAEVLDVSA